MAVRRIGDRFAIEFQQAGRRIFRRCPPGITKQEASQFEVELRRAAFRQDKLGERRVVLLAAAIELWLAETTATKRDQKKPRQNALLLAPYVADKSLEQAPDAAQEAVNAWGATLASSTINRRLAVLKAVCKHSWRRGLIDRDLSGMIPMLREPAPREIYLTRAEVDRLAKAAPNPQTRAAIMILAYSGLRVGELLELGKVPRRAANLHIPDSKTGKPRLVPVVDTIRPFLGALPLGVSYRRLVGWYWEARIAAKLEHVRIHDLRHTTASWLAAKGASLQEIAELLGDTMLTAQRYVHLLPGRKADAMRRIG